jgi:Eco57I restriction-modification methylase
MTLEKLLTSLGYDGSPCFLKRGDGAFESEFGYGHIFRRAQEPKDLKNPKPPRWQAVGVYGIREPGEKPGRFIPIVYVCTAKDEKAAGELHRLLWNQDVAPYIIVHTGTSIRVYSGFCYEPHAKSPEQQGVIAALNDFTNAQSIVDMFERCEIDEGRLWHDPRLRVDASRRVYHRLLASLRELDVDLQSGEKGLSKDVSHALIGKYVYLRYLRDRGILSPERLAKWDLKAEDIFGPKAKKSSLAALNEKLDEWLNGEIFPLPWHGINAPSSVQIQAVAGAFCGAEHSAGGTQGHLDFEAYNFAFIPIETLSLVYEQFLHSEDPNANQETTATKTKGRQQGAYYTPLPLVNFMLAELERQHPLQKGMKVFDPSSGSGSFLVQAYRLLIEKTFPYNKSKTKPKPSELRELLEDSIFGCDVDGDACQVTQLSLLLTLLDYVDPPDLTGPMHSFKLPTLCVTTNKEKLAAGHTPNLLKHNFFGIEALLGEAVVGKQGAKADWLKQGFDWIVGNPPWKTISPGKLGKNEAPVWEWMKDHAKTKPVGLNQAAQAFAWEAPRYLKSSGECALLLPAMGLFEEPSKNFRKNFFSTFQVHTVANFANFARILFEKRADVAAAAISYRLRAEDEDSETHESITVFSPFVVNQEATCPLKEGERGKLWSLSINASEVSYLEQREAASGSGLPWKLTMWGSPWDERLLRRMEKKWPSLGAIEGSQLTVAQGPELRMEAKRADLATDEDIEDIEETEDLEEEPEKEITEPCLELISKLSLEVKKLNRLRHIFTFPKTALPKNQKGFLRLRGGKAGLAVSKPPHVIVSAARNFAVYSDEFIIVPPRQIGIISCTQNKDFLKALSVFLSSDFAFYHQFFRSTQLGVQRGRATFESLRQMPIPLTHLSRDQLQEWTTLHGKLAKCQPRRMEGAKKKGKTKHGELKLGDIPESDDAELDGLLVQLNKLTADALGLTKEECSLIHDLVQVRYALNDGKRGDAAMRAPEPKELRAYAQALKDELDEFVGDEAERSHRITIISDERSAMIEIDFTKDLAAARKPSILDATHAEAKALSKARERLLGEDGARQWAYFNRNLRIYRGRKVYVFKPLNRFHWMQSAALTDASQIIAETLAGA